MRELLGRGLPDGDRARLLDLLRDRADVGHDVDLES